MEVKESERSPVNAPKKQASGIYLQRRARRRMMCLFWSAAIRRSFTLKHDIAMKLQIPA